MSNYLYICVFVLRIDVTPWLVHRMLIVRISVTQGICLDKSDVCCIDNLLGKRYEYDSRIIIILVNGCSLYERRTQVFSFANVVYGQFFHE